MIPVPAGAGARAASASTGESLSSAIASHWPNAASRPLDMGTGVFSGRRTIMVRLCPGFGP